MRTRGIVDCQAAFLIAASAALWEGKMKIKSIISMGLALSLAGGLVLGTAADADAKKVRWKMQSTFGSKLPHLGTSGVRFTANVKDMTDGQLNIKFFEPGALVPSLECFDSVSKGALESCWTTPGYHTAKYPALAFFTTVPFGPQIGEFMAWKWFGGGNDLKQEIYDKHNLIAFDSFAIGPETSGWFKTEITSLEQIKGLKMRFFGLGAKVMQKMGAATQLLAGADIYPALERGVIDATEFSMPTIDIKLGFHQIAKYNYFPGWHQQVSVSELLMNKDAWNKLSKAHKTIIKVGLGDSVMHTYAETEAKNFGGMAVMQNKHGVTIKRWPDETLAKFEKAWFEVVKEESAKDPIFKKVADHFYDFRAKYKVWGDAQSLKGTYLK
jgi:TRAP-type mannitol/chloroaromatic compound transport system substrate-binding protein|tara:strand:+ start:247 stop:1395 length:1149 start_codon:yes stop_codon:yes gene_type:complete